MCGRFSVDRVERVASAFPKYRFPEAGPQFNIAPTMPILVKRNDPSDEVVFMRWGLVPGFASSLAIGGKMINARSETLATRSAFRNALVKRRCLIFATSFYEWRTTPAGKEPVLFQMRSGEPFVFAGLYERWWGPKDARFTEPVESATIVTTQPNELVAALHDRMPAILGSAARERWLDSGADVHAALATLEPFPAAAMRAFNVDRRVNRVAFDDPLCTAPLTEFVIV